MMTPAAPHRRRILRTLALAGPALAAGCSVLPDRPYQETERFALAPERPGARVPAPPGAPVLLLRTLGAAPGLDVRGLRIRGPGDRVRVEFWSEWAAPPADAAEEALRRWLGASGLVSAIVAPGSLLRADLALEGQLTRLDAAPALGEARAGLALLLLRGPEAEGAGRGLLAQILAEGRAPLPGGPQAEGSLRAAEAMVAALADALAQVEVRLRAALAEGPGRRR